LDILLTDNVILTALHFRESACKFEKHWTTLCHLYGTILRRRQL